MSPWAILEIEPTDDLSVIKKAYSRKLKVYHPEEDPQGYQRLREAYDWILKERKKGSLSAASFTIVAEDETEELEEELIIPPLNWFDDHHSLHSKEDLADPFMQKAEKVYFDFHSRINPDAWMELLNDDAMWDFEAKQEVSNRLLQFLKVHHFLSPSVWLLLESSFQWKEMMREQENLDEEDSCFFEYYQKQIGPCPLLSYSYLKNADGIDFDTYLRFREAALDAFLSNHLEEAEARIQDAYTIFQGDGDLLRLRGNVFFQMGRLDEGVQSFLRILDLNPLDFEVKLLVAYALYEQNALKEAAAACKEILNTKPDQADARSLYGKILFKERKFVSAREQFKILQDQNPGDVDAIAYLAKIHGLMVNWGIKKKDNGGISKRQLKKEVRTPRIWERAVVFLRALVSLRVILFLAGIIISWKPIAESLYMYHEPFWLSLFVFISHILNPSFFTSYDVWMILFLTGIFLLAHEIKRAYRLARF